MLFQFVYYCLSKLTCACQLVCQIKSKHFKATYTFGEFLHYLDEFSPILQRDTTYCDFLLFFASLDSPSKRVSSLKRENLFLWEQVFPKELTPIEKGHKKCKRQSCSLSKCNHLL